MEVAQPPKGYSEGDVLKWLDQAKVLLEQTQARIASTGGKLTPADRQAVTDNLVLIANVVTHLSRQALRPAGDPPAGETETEVSALVENPSILARLHDIHAGMQAVLQRLKAGSPPLN